MRVEGADLATAVAFAKLPGVVPSRIVHVSAEPEVLLVDAGRTRFLGAFLEDSIAHALAEHGGFARRIRAPLDLFGADARFEDEVPLAGVVFHVSRCGSTIPVRVLQASESTNVVPEAEPIDAVVTRMQVDDATRVRMLRNAVAMYARRRTPKTERLVLKLDAWHLVHHRVFREAFPDVPFVVVVRDPLDVLLSHVHRRGSHVVPGLFPASLFDIESTEFQPFELDRYGALVLRSLYRHARVAVREGAELVRFDDLPAAAFDRILPSFGVSLDVAELASTAWLATGHAKLADQVYDAGSDAARREGAEHASAQIDALVRDDYAALVGG